MKTKFKQVALLAAISSGFATSAWSANLPFTFTPSGTNPALTTNAGAIVADTMQGFDNAVITITQTSAGVYDTTESGIFSVQSMTLGGNSLIGGALAGLNSGGADTWGLYYTFSLTSTGGTFLQVDQPLSSFLFSLYGDQGSNTTFTSSGVTAGTNATDVLLASGTLINGTAGLASGNPFNLALQVVDTFNINNPDAGSFFTAPNPFYLQLGASATAFAQNNVSSDCGAGGPAVGLSCNINITAGGAVAAYAVTPTVPEPEALALVGLGLFGLGLTRRKWS